jgi:hypothetical protein
MAVSNLQPEETTMTRTRRTIALSLAALMAARARL